MCTGAQGRAGQGERRGAPARRRGAAGRQPGRAPGPPRAAAAVHARIVAAPAQQLLNLGKIRLCMRTCRACLPFPDDKKH